MKVVLIQDVKKVGKRGSVIEVADGYGNFLIQKGFAKPGTTSIVAQAVQVARKKESDENHEAEIMVNAYKMLEGREIKIPVRVNEKGVMYAQVHALDISDAIKKIWNVHLPSGLITLSAPLKHTGVFDIDLKSGKVKKVLTIELVAQGLIK